jgi:hypothetical protein
MADTPDTNAYLSILMDDHSYIRTTDADADPKAYFDKLRNANYQRRFKENDPDYVVKKKAYDANRKGRSGKRFADKSHSGGNFIAIDAEGMDIGAQFRVGKVAREYIIPMTILLKRIKIMINIRITAQYYGWRAA